MLIQYKPWIVTHFGFYDQFSYRSFTFLTTCYEGICFSMWIISFVSYHLQKRFCFSWILGRKNRELYSRTFLICITLFATITGLWAMIYKTIFTIMYAMQRCNATDFTFCLKSIIWCCKQLLKFLWLHWNYLRRKINLKILKISLVMRWEIEVLFAVCTELQIFFK